MKFFTRKYFAPVMKLAVSAISSSEAIDEPRMWNTANVIWPERAASRKPMSRKAARIGDIRPARTSITVTDGATALKVSKIGGGAGGGGGAAGAGGAGGGRGGGP